MYRKLLPDCALGVLVFPDELIYTIEQPLRVTEEHRSGEPFHSCVPFGRYELKPYSSTKYPDVFVLVNPALGVYKYKVQRRHETDRWACLFHVLNYASEASGCIGPGVGTKYDKNRRARMVTHSSDAMGRLRALLPSYTHLDILPLG
jgi:hypothetical protein